MAAVPILEEFSSAGPNAVIGELAGLPARHQVSFAPVETALEGRPLRRLAIYPASAGFDLVDELEHLCARTVEPNIFFNPHFLAPAMPRVDDREVRLAVMRDGDETQSRLRMLMPFSVERPAIPLGVPVLRCWSSPFSPLATPLVDADDPAGVIADFLAMLARPHLKLPSVIALPEIRLDGPFAGIMRGVADEMGLAFETEHVVQRPFLESRLEGDAYLKASLGTKHFKEYQRLRRRLGERGRLEHVVARQPEEVRFAAEAFLALENSGWKGRGRSAMATDRYRAAFAREAINGLASRDHCRIHMLTLDGVAIASLVVFIENGTAYTWKTAYDETYAPWSPGTLLMMAATRHHLDDPNIVATDSCAVPDHPVVSRMWSERVSVGTMVIGLKPGLDRQVRQATQQIYVGRESRNMARLVRARIKQLIRKS